MSFRMGLWLAIVNAIPQDEIMTELYMYVFGDTQHKHNICYIGETISEDTQEMPQWRSKQHGKAPQRAVTRPHKEQTTT